MNTAAETQTADEFSARLKDYRTNRSVELRNEIVMHYSYIARAVAVQMRGISLNYAQLEDIVNQGIITLIDCVEKFDPDKGIKFDSYAFMRVRGAIIDFVRKQDWLPRRVRVTAKAICAAHDYLANELMREPSQQELADHLDMPLEKLSRSYGEISNSVMLSFEGTIQNIAQTGGADRMVDEDSAPEQSIFKNELRETLKNAIDSLSERERLVVSLYYYERLRLSDIAKVLEVSEQRVSQINSKAIMKLKYTMENYMKG